MEWLRIFLTPIHSYAFSVVRYMCFLILFASGGVVIDDQS